MVSLNTKDGGDRSPSPGSRDGPRMSSCHQIPYAEITLVDRVTNRPTPPAHYEKHFSQDRILKTTFQQKKFQDFERSAKQTE